MYEKFGQFIDGKWQKSSGGETYNVINPATEEILGKASKASIKEIELSLKSAEKGFQIWIIPHTYKETNLSKLKKFGLVNIEIDILSKYVRNYFYEKK